MQGRKEADEASVPESTSLSEVFEYTEVYYSRQSNDEEMYMQSPVSRVEAAHFSISLNGGLPVVAQYKNVTRLNGVSLDKRSDTVVSVRCVEPSAPQQV